MNWKGPVNRIAVGGEPVLTLPWLRQLRWSAVAGQLVTVLIVHWGLKVPLPLDPVFLCIGLIAVTNALLWLVPLGSGESSASVAGVLAVDVALLTFLLHVT